MGHNSEGMESPMQGSIVLVLAVLLAPVVSFAQEPLHKKSSTGEPARKLGIGDHRLSVKVNDQTRSAVVHVPPGYNAEKATPLVLALHGAAMTGEMMPSFTGLNSSSNQHGFIVVYPNGTGLGPLQTWNSGGFIRGVGTRVDDVSFFRMLLDELEAILNVDSKRIYATGMSNGGMMSYRLAAELSDRIASIAPVGGTMPVGDAKPSRPVSLIHFHGTLDTLVPFDGSAQGRSPLMTVKSVEDSVQTWAKLDGIEGPPNPAQVISKEGDDLKVTRQDFGIGNEGTEVVLIVIEGGGHTWPGELPPVKFLGKSAMNISANDLMWEFFKKHPRK